MPDTLDESNALLARLIREITKETDPVKYDELAAEIRYALEARELLKEELKKCAA